MMGLLYDLDDDVADATVVGAADWSRAELRSGMLSRDLVISLKP